MIGQKAGTVQPSMMKKWGLGLSFCLALALSGTESWAQSPSPASKKAEAAKPVSSEKNDDWGFTFPRFFANFDDIPKLPDNRVGVMGLINNERRGSRHGPAYEGNVFGMHASLRPDIDYTYQDRFFINADEGMGFYLYNDKKFYTGVSAYGREGRGNGPHRMYSGLGRIDTAAQARAFVGYDMGFLDVSASVARDIGGTDGTTVELKASNVLPLTPKLFLMPQVGLTFGNSTFMQGFYGVNATQSLNSGLAVYKAKSGLESFDYSASLVYVIDKKWAPFIRAEGRYLYGSADKTPIYYRRMVTGVGIGVSYLFD
jgi:outer membrane scaffolding protein for murein synthesis (MipA/OmpV family)